MDQPIPADAPHIPASCPNCRGTGVVPDDDENLMQYAAACGALPGDDCPNCEGRGVLDLPGDQPDKDDLDAMAASMVDGLAIYLGAEDRD